jgi:hypothetical protein
MIDIGGDSDLLIYLSTNAFKVRASAPASDPAPVVTGYLTLTGLAGDAPPHIPIYGLGINTPAGEAQIFPDVTGLVTAALTVTSFWTYDGLYDAATGAWVGP